MDVDFAQPCMVLYQNKSESSGCPVPGLASGLLNLVIHAKARYRAEASLSKMSVEEPTGNGLRFRFFVISSNKKSL